MARLVPFEILGVSEPLAAPANMRAVTFVVFSLVMPDSKLAGAAHGIDRLHTVAHYWLETSFRTLRNYSHFQAPKERVSSYQAVE
jgi:hypothetical protein